MYWSVCVDGEGKGNVSAGDFGLDRPGCGGVEGVLRLDRRGCGGGEGDLDEVGEGVLGRHRPVRVRDGGVGKMVPSTRDGFGVLHFLLEMFIGAKPCLKSIRPGDSGSRLTCFLPCCFWRSQTECQV